MLFVALRKLSVRVGHRNLSKRRCLPRFAGRAAEVLEGRQLLAATLWVDPASTHAGDFHTIQSAVNAAAAGDTIKVAPGTYTESVVVPTSVTILGGQVHLPGEKGPSIVESGTVGFTLSANTETLSGFTIEMAATASGQFPVGVLTADTTGVKIESNIIRSDSGAAIELAGGVTNALLMNNSLKSVIGPVGTGGADGIDIDTADSMSVNSGEQISGNRISGFDDGILIGGAGTTADDQVVGNSVSDAGSVGIDNLSEGNTFLANFVTNAGMTGISSSANSVTLVANFVTGSGGDGIDAMERSDTGASTFLFNTTNNNGLTGLDVAGGRSSIVIGNTANRNQFFGMEVIGDDDTVALNTANHNALTGIVFAGTSSTIEFNSASGDNIGLNLGGISCTVRDNTADNNATDGFFISFSSSTVSGNTANKNGTDGFRVANFQTSTVSNNAATANGGDGFDFQSALGNTINGNVARKNGADGIALDSASSGNTIENNTALDNTVDDLFDGSTGTGTAGTANTWSDNTADTRSPAGLS